MTGGSHLDIDLIHHIHKSTFYKHLWITLKLIDDHPKYALEFPVDDEEKLRSIAHRFNHMCGGVMAGCCGALDGIAIAIIKPSVCNPGDYRNRKGFYAFVLQAICDANRKFMWASMATSGTTHDSLAFNSAP